MGHMPLRPRPRPARAPMMPIDLRPSDYRMSDNYLDKSTLPIKDALGDLRLAQNGGASVHCYGGFIIVHRRNLHQPPTIFVFHSDDGYQHCRPVDFNKLPQQTIRDLAMSMRDLNLSMSAISLAIGLRPSTIQAIIDNAQPDIDIDITTTSVS